MFKTALAALPILLLSAVPVSAQLVPHPRIEANIGYDRSDAQGAHRNRFGYGATAGADVSFPAGFVIGVEGSYWQARRRNQLCTVDGAGNTQCIRSGRELGFAGRVGFHATPALLLYGKGGYANNRQSGTFVSPKGIYYINGQIVGPGYATSNRDTVGGYQLGGGAEYSLMSNIYVSAQYIWSRYKDHTTRQRGVVGIGVHF